MHMTGENSLYHRLMQDILHGLECCRIWLLLLAAARRITRQKLLRRRHQIGAILFGRQTVFGKRRRIERRMHAQYNRIAFGGFRSEHFGLPFGNAIIRIIQSHKVDAAVELRIEIQVRADMRCS